MYAMKSLDDDREILDFPKIHRSANQTARQAYQDKYGIDYREDPEWEIGNERHAFWLDAFDTRATSLIIDPHQS